VKTFRFYYSILFSRRIFILLNEDNRSPAARKTFLFICFSIIVNPGSDKIDFLRENALVSVSFCSAPEKKEPEQRQSTISDDRVRARALSLKFKEQSGSCSHFWPCSPIPDLEVLEVSKVDWTRQVGPSNSR